MAYYDPLTDEIHDAVPGSWAYLHEERHREQYRKGWARRADHLHIWLYYGAFIGGGVGAWVLGPWGWCVGVGLAMTPHIMSLALLEIDAYVVGTWKWIR